MGECGKGGMGNVKMRENGGGKWGKEIRDEPMRDGKMWKLENGEWGNVE